MLLLAVPSLLNSCEVRLQHLTCKPHTDALAVLGKKEDATLEDDDMELPLCSGAVLNSSTLLGRDEALVRWFIDMGVPAMRKGLGAVFAAWQ